MKREKLTITMGTEMKKFVQRRASAEFESVSHYIRELVKEDNYRQREWTKERNHTAGRNGSNTGAPRAGAWTVREGQDM